MGRKGWRTLPKVYAGILVATAQGTLWLAPALWAHGVVLVFLFAPLHETIHLTAFRSRRLNDTVAWLAGAVLIWVALEPNGTTAIWFSFVGTPLLVGGCALGLWALRRRLRRQSQQPEG